MMTPNGFTEMMSNVLCATGKKDADINADVYKKQLADVKEFVDEDGLRASTLLIQELSLPKNIIAYLYNHMSISSNKRNKNIEQSKPFVKRYDETREKIRLKRGEKIMSFFKECIHEKISDEKFKEFWDEMESTNVWGF